MTKEEIPLLRDNPYGLGTECIETLIKITDVNLIKWAYLAIIEGLSIKTINTVIKGEEPIKSLKEARESFLKKKYSDVDLIRSEISGTLEHANNAITESEEMRKLFTENMEKMVNSSQQVFEEKLRLKDETIKQLQMKLEQQEVHTTVPIVGTATPISASSNLDNKEGVVSETTENSIPVKNESDEKVLLTGKLQVEPTEKINIQKVQESKGQKKTSMFSFFSTGKTSNLSKEKFIANYLANEEFSMEQKEFLLDCLEHGIEPGEIEKFAIPSLDLAIMKRLSKVGVQTES